MYTGEGITAPVFEALDSEDIDELKSKLKLGGRKIIAKLHKEILAVTK